jgi:hypothetical protein
MALLNLPKKYYHGYVRFLDSLPPAPAEVRNMRLLGTVMMAAIVASAWAGETGEARASSVTVCVDKGGPDVSSSAQLIASKVFGSIALKINWVAEDSCRPPST